MTKTTTVSLNTIICNTIINLLNDIKKAKVQYWSRMLKSWIKPIGSIYSTQIRMNLSMKVFSLLIYSVTAKTCLKNVKLTAWVYQYSDRHVKFYMWCFGSALKSPISHIQGHKTVNPDKVLVLIKSSLWQSTEARTLSGFDCTRNSLSFRCKLNNNTQVQSTKLYLAFYYWL